MLNDPLANALSTMKNAEIKGKGTCIIQPSSKLIGGVLNLLKENEKVNIITNTEIKKIEGSQFVEKATISINGDEQVVSADYAFLYLGTKSNKEMFSMIANTDEKGYLITDEKMQTLMSRCTWDLVPGPAGSNIVTCRWMFTVKYKPDGMVDKYKACRVAHGFTQEYGVDYEGLSGSTWIHTGIWC